MDKRGIEFNFALLFSIIVGAAILFLAIYFSVSFIKSNTKEEESFIAKQLTIIFDPMETGIAEGESLYFRFNEDTKIYNECYEDEFFGYHKFSVSSKKFNKWEEKGANVKVNNKYVFSDSYEEGKEFIIFSKPLKMPFKISELIFISSKNYCFKQAPSFIKDDIESLNLRNIKFSNCSKDDIVVCFSSLNSVCSAADIIVEGQCNNLECESEFDYGRVKKNGEELYYYGNLMYGAIFSNKKVYECNVRRLMKRLINLALLYSNEANFIKGRIGCGSVTSLIDLASASSIVKESKDLLNVNLLDKIKKVKEENDASECELW